MAAFLNVLLGALTLGLPLWFSYLDTGVFPSLKWVRPGEAPPLWGRMVVFIGVGLAILVAIAAPIAGFHAEH